MSLLGSILVCFKFKSTENVAMRWPYFPRLQDFEPKYAENVFNKAKKQYSNLYGIYNLTVFSSQKV